MYVHGMITRTWEWMPCPQSRGLKKSIKHYSCQNYSLFLCRLPKIFLKMAFWLKVVFIWTVYSTACNTRAVTIIELSLFFSLAMSYKCNQKSLCNNKVVYLIIMNIYMHINQHKKLLDAQKAVTCIWIP